MGGEPPELELARAGVPENVVEAGGGVGLGMGQHIFPGATTGLVGQEALFRGDIATGPRCSRPDSGPAVPPPPFPTTRPGRSGRRPSRSPAAAAGLCNVGALPRRWQRGDGQPEDDQLCRFDEVWGSGLDGWGLGVGAGIPFLPAAVKKREEGNGWFDGGMFSEQAGPPALTGAVAQEPCGGGDSKGVL